MHLWVWPAWNWGTWLPLQKRRTEQAPPTVAVLGRHPPPPRRARACPAGQLLTSVRLEDTVRPTWPPVAGCRWDRTCIVPTRWSPPAPQWAVKPPAWSRRQTLTPRWSLPVLMPYLASTSATPHQRIQGKSGEGLRRRSGARAINGRRPQLRLQW